jgi:O-methyltransferase
MDILQNLYDKVSNGGFVIIDDYHALEPCRRAVTDFRASREITDPIVLIDRYGVYWRKGRSSAPRLAAAQAAARHA